MIVDSKQSYYELAAKNVFGNILRIWDGVGAWRESEYRGPIRFRSKIPGSGIFTKVPLVGRTQILRAYDELVGSGCSPRDVMFCEPAPERFLVFQGEVVDDPALGGVHLTWSTEPGITNREAMSRPQGITTGLASEIVLDYYLEPEDRSHLSALLDDWPEHVVEFSAYSIRVGNLRRKMVVWEVRKY